MPQQILPRLEHVILEEGLTVTEDGKTALMALSGGDMRKVINVLQSTWMAYKLVNEENVYTCVGHPLKKDITNIVYWLLNEQEFADVYKSRLHFIRTSHFNHFFLLTEIIDLKTAKGLALEDILTEIHLLVHRSKKSIFV